MPSEEAMFDAVCAYLEKLFLLIQPRGPPWVCLGKGWLALLLLLSLTLSLSNPHPSPFFFLPNHRFQTCCLWLSTALRRAQR